MLSLGIFEQTKWVKYSEDEEYEIIFTSSDQIRLEAGRNNLIPESMLSEQEITDIKRDEADTEEAKEFNLITDFMNAVYNTEVVKRIAVNAVKGWKGITDLEGKALPCTDENKEIIFKHFANRSLFIYKKTCNESLFNKASLESDLKN